MVDLMVTLLLLAIVGMAGRYIYKEKKRGAACIGCPSGGCCSGRQGGCSCGSSKSREKE